MSTVHIGTSGFSYKDWVGPVYPKGLHKAGWLTYYARELGFRACELNFTYYRLPDPRTLQRMADKVPEGFTFTLKATRRPRTNTVMSHLSRLCCPACNDDLNLSETQAANGEVQKGQLSCTGCGQIHPIINFVPRFVSAENYADTFGLQWNRFRQTQLDSHSGLPISRERFFRQTGWASDDLSDKVVLDVGCGAGRFAEIALSYGAIVVGLDYSSAVDACWQNLGEHRNMHVIQADIYALPFRPGRPRPC